MTEEAVTAMSLSIAELYGAIGTSVSLDALLSLSSYRMFRKSVEDTFREIGYLR